MNDVATLEMTTEELLALPEDDGVERELIRGELHEEPMSERSRRHGRVTGKLGGLLNIWLSQQPEPRGEVLVGDAGFRLRRKPDTTVGIDVAYISAELSAATPEDARYVDGVPVLAAEVLSPSDKQQTITKKIAEYLAAGVRLVWVVEPVFRTVTIYRPDAKPSLVHDAERLTGGPHLPGFDVAVADVFNK
jgi:Uma2 family endonuclease